MHFKIATTKISFISASIDSIKTRLCFDNNSNKTLMYGQNRALPYAFFIIIVVVIIIIIIIIIKTQSCLLSLSNSLSN